MIDSRLIRDPAARRAFFSYQDKMRRMHHDHVIARRVPETTHRHFHSMVKREVEFYLLGMAEPLLVAAWRIEQLCSAIAGEARPIQPRAVSLPVRIR